MPRPNILYIFTDQQSAGAMSCAGNPYVHTPAMDGLAEGGVRFERAYSPYPLCTPARASMFAGRMPHEVGIDRNGQPIDEAFRQEELGNLLAANGYDCAYGGKWHVPEIAIPEGHGFERICGFDDVELPSRCCEFMTAERGRPFFLVAAFDNPHNICEWRREQSLPWGDIGQPPAVEDCPPLPANFAIPPCEPTVIREAVRANPRVYTQADYSPEQWRRYRWAYNRLVEKVDGHIGTILDCLREKGLAENTLVLFSSDHGDHQGAHRLSQKSILYEEAARVPFIVRMKGLTQGEHVDTHLVSNGPDLYATICDFAGIEMPDGMFGRSVRPLLSGESVADWPDHLVAETNFPAIECPGRMVRTEQFKYVAYARGPYREQLFDLENDPGEMANLADCSHYQEVLQHHRGLLRAWCEKTNDGFGGHHYSHRETPFMVPGDDYYG
ncbi:MAG: sulfatase [Armatimonadota bacterium]